MNILIPLAGLGKRFSDAGYKTIKPLIEINGQPMIIQAVKSLGFQDYNPRYIFIIRDFEGHIDLYKKLVEHFPGCIIEYARTITEGPACSALLAKKYINNDVPLIIANCDQIMQWEHRSFESFCYRTHLDGAVVTFEGGDEKHSFAKLNQEGLCSELAEKVVISNIALNGIHFWLYGRDFVTSAEAMIRENSRAPNGEFYVAPSYNWMIKRGLKVGIYHIPTFVYNSVGTPEDLERYIKRLNDNR